ncbi:MAG: aminodeoxychorismate/anthranilate synthase component II [Halobacteriaceae archaeon]
MSAPDRVDDPGPRILVIDNYDSFVYNLVQYVGSTEATVEVRRNDAISLAEVRAIDPDGIVVSPGPGTPQSAGISMRLFETVSVPMLGVCLGHQALSAVHDVPVGHAPDVVHGKASTITHDGRGLFAGLPPAIDVGRYHSLCAPRTDLPATLVETASTDDERGTLMAVRHTKRPHVGVQFHPESILTPEGLSMVESFVGWCDGDSLPPVWAD